MRAALLLIAIVECLAACGRVGFEGASFDDANGGGIRDGGACATPVPASGNQTRPAVASNGAGEFLVAWEDDRDGTVDVYGARVTAAGVVDPTGIAIHTGGMYARRAPAVASNGTDYYVVWRLDEPAPGPDVYGRLVRDGAPVGDAPNLSRNVGFGAFANGTIVDVAGEPGGGFVAVWARHGSGSELAARSVDANGAVLAGAEPCNSAGTHPAIVWGQGMFVVAYNRAGALSVAQLGLPLTELGCAAQGGTPSCDRACAPVAFDADGFVVTWRNSSGVRFRRVDPAIVDDPGVLVTADGTHPAIAGHTDARFVIAWIEANQVHSQMFTSTGLGYAPVVVGPAGSNPRYPAVAFDGTRFLVVAETSGSASEQDIEGWFLEPEEGQLVGKPFVISGGGCE